MSVPSQKYVHFLETSKPHKLTKSTISRYSIARNSNTLTCCLPDTAFSKDFETLSRNIDIYILTTHMTVQQPQSMHFVYPGELLTSLTIDSIDEVGETKFTG